jgi:hypothetical protein
VLYKKPNDQKKMNTSLFDMVVVTSLFQDYRLIVERRFASPNVPKIYAGGSISFW